MQRCNCDVRLGGDIGNTVPKTGVSPAEIVILRFLHSDDAVINIQPTGMDKVPHTQERERLKYTYGDEVVAKVFPGDYSKLPVSLKEVMPREEGAEEPEDEDEPTDSDPYTPPPAATPSHELTPDDRELIETITTAKTKAEVRDLAIANEVDLSDVPDKLDDLKKAVVTGLFPNYQL